MRLVPKKQGVKSASQFLFEAVSGRLGVLVMSLAYAAFAVLLLAYVSTQVYTSSLLEDIAKGKREQRAANEEIGLLAMRYAELVSKSRISSYCEGRLGMVAADRARMTRISVDGSNNNQVRVLELTDRSLEMPRLLGSQIGELTEAVRR